MKIIYLWVSIIAIVGIAGMASLGNTIAVESTGIGVFSYFVDCILSPNGADLYICKTNTEAAGQTDVLNSKIPGLAVDVIPNTVLGSDSGCSPIAWASADDSTDLKWPEGYLPDDKYGSPAYFNTVIKISSGEDPTLREALLAEGDGINKLARHSVAAVLNSAHEEMNYPSSIIDTISYTQAGIENEDYSYADVLEVNNNQGKDTLCDKVE